jgi:outer membrane protein assembly factor BamD
MPLLGEMTHKRELSAAKESFQDLGDFIDRFPESEYAGNAKQRMIYLRNLIAKQEIYVAEFYIERKAYIAALGRADYVIKHMSRTPSVERALEIMVLVYEELDQNDLKVDAQEALLEYKNKRS